MTKIRGADALVRSLAAAGVRNVFTLSGNHIMPVFDASLDAGLDLVHTRHEAATVHMADAWARITGEVGIALVTGGPGHANAVSALYTALMAESPVVLISGHAPHDELGRGAFQEMRQAEMAGPVVKASWTSATASGIGADIARAMCIAKSGRPGPVHLSIPTDVLEGRVDDAALASGRSVRARMCGPCEKRCSSDPGQAPRRETAADPGGTRVDDARWTRAPAALEAATGVACVGMESPRGINDPCLGAFRRESLRQVDCVLLLGKATRFHGWLSASRRVRSGLRIPADRSRSGRDRAARRGRCQVGSRRVRWPAVVSSIEILIAEVAQRASSDRIWANEVRAAIAYRPAEWGRAHSTDGKLHPVEACRPLQALLDRHPQSVLVCDGGEFGQWAQACLTRRIA
jgi:acetolactate synthase-1/2/3 large subunit